MFNNTTLRSALPKHPLVYFTQPKRYTLVRWPVSQNAPCAWFIKQKRTILMEIQANAALAAGGVDGGGGDGSRGDSKVVRWVAAAAETDGGGRRVEESGCGDRIDPVMRSVFGVGRKSPPEKFSGDGYWWPAAAG
ncbi:hypothetical protein Tco_1429737 [Tanacetum coccineum]